ncbi:MAG TPA: phage Gp37/Gp68 family protein [Longimicrobium sp.]|nr:phage Gp37/Gp68 family protein [Longimicrobium sp.]
MRNSTKIEWTDSTWNPTTGCTQVSAGCDHCYALALARTRLADAYLRRLPVVPTESNVEDPFAVRIWEERLSQPDRWTDSRRIFVNSMSDLFHHDIPEAFVRRVFEVMLRVDRHIYQVLTKRPGRALRFFARNRDLFVNGLIPGHIWMGASVENEEASYRVAQLRELPAVVRFLSCEPLLGPIQLDLTGIHWVIVGGESGADFRPLDLGWARSIREQCFEAGVAFFFKQVGGRTPKSGGRLLDDKIYDAYPEIDPVIPEAQELVETAV